MDRRYERHYMVVTESHSWSRGETTARRIVTERVTKHSMSTGMFRGRVMLINREAEYPFFPVCLDCENEVMFNSEEFAYWCPYCKREMDY